MHTRHMRHRGPGAQEIVEYARYIGMDPISDVNLLWIAGHVRLKAAGSARSVGLDSHATVMQRRLSLLRCQKDGRSIPTPAATAFTSTQQPEAALGSTHWTNTTVLCSSNSRKFLLKIALLGK